MQRRVRDKISAILLSTVLIHCGGDDGGGSNPVEPLGEASVEIASIRSSEGERFERAEFDDISLPCDGNLSVFFTVDNWTLRPPGACAGAEQCGYLTLSVDGDQLVKSSAGKRVALEALELSEPVGEHQLEVELVRDDGEPYLFEEVPVSDQVTVGFSGPEVCGQGGGGAGGEGGASGMAGAGGTRD